MILRSIIVPFVVVGLGVMLESGNDNLTKSSRLPLAYAIGLRQDAVAARVEYSSFRTSDGNQTLSIQREHQAWQTWVEYEFEGEGGWRPYVGGALGIGRSNAETKMSSQPTELSRGAWSGNFAAALGMRGVWSEHVSVRPELRYESAEGLKTKDARWGVFVHVQYSF